MVRVERLLENPGKINLSCADYARSEHDLFESDTGSHESEFSHDADCGVLLLEHLFHA